VERTTRPARRRVAGEATAIGPGSTKGILATNADEAR
jgi:hypothetical protein